MRLFSVVFFVVLVLALESVQASSCEAPAFDDAALGELLREGSDVLVYVWSPLMSLSALGRDEISDFAEDGFIVRVVMDPADRLCGLVAAEDRLGSKFLLAHSGLNHFPTLFYFREGELVLTLHGYELPGRLKARLLAVRDAHLRPSLEGVLP